MGSTVVWSQLVEHLTGFAHLATVRADGRPHVSKVAPAVDGDALWIATRASSRKARNIAEWPHVALMFEPRAEVYLDCDAHLVHGAETKQAIWTSGLFAFPLEGFFGSHDHPDFVLVRLVPTAAILMSQGEAGVRRDTWTRHVDA